MARDRVVITGLGAFTPLGPDLARSWVALIEGRIAVGPLRRFDASGFTTRIAAEAPYPLPGDGPGPRLAFDRRTRMAVAAAAEAWADAGLPPGGTGPYPPHRVAVSVGAEAARKLLEDAADRYFQVRDLGSLRDALPVLDPTEFPRLHMSEPGRRIAEGIGATGPMRTSSTACTSGSQALGVGLRLLQRGEADAVLAGGCDALVEAFMAMGFGLLGALSQRNDDPARASRPFDLDRDGFVLGEGAGFVVLERESWARARGARIHAALLGYGSSNNAYRVTDSPPDGGGAWQAMALAVADADLQPADIGYVNAHGTSTVMNDISETHAIRRALGHAADRVAVSSNKGQMGHLVAAAGAVEACFTALALREGILPPTVNLDKPDPACDLDYVPNEARRTQVDYALSNSFGFGGSNATLALGRVD